MIRTLLRRATRGRWPHVRPGEALSCREVGRLLQRYLDEELSGEVEAASLAEHLDECRRCGLEADTYRHIKESLRQRRQPVPEESVRRLREFGRRLTDG
jgi:predicted anti-sigma-YlaC factor YlaD